MFFQLFGRERYFQTSSNTLISNFNQFPVSTFSIQCLQIFPFSYEGMENIFKAIYRTRGVEALFQFSKLLCHGVLNYI